MIQRQRCHWAYVLRNPFALLSCQTANRLFSDVGEEAFEEINIIERVPTTAAASEGTCTSCPLCEPGICLSSYGGLRIDYGSLRSYTGSTFPPQSTAPSFTATTPLADSVPGLRPNYETFLSDNDFEQMLGRSSIGIKGRMATSLCNYLPGGFYKSRFGRQQARLLRSADPTAGLLPLTVNFIGGHV